jgi:N-acetylglucosamine kinase-like BadF-type ATPase
MIAVVYSGSRHADWKLADKGQIISDFKTSGINPFAIDEKTISQLLNKNNQLITYAEKIKRIYFFGSGASSAERKQIIANAFSRFFRFGKVIVEHDLKAAALATCSDDPGIVGILGSGSNAAYFDGKKVKENNYGLGFILADEGSANWMGRRLLKNYLNGTLPPEVEQKFLQKYNVDRKQILDKVYRQPQPALYLSSFVDFLSDNRNEEYVKKTVTDGFKEYFEKYIIPLSKKYPDVPINFAGTVAAGFQEWLKETAEQKSLSITNIVKEPIYNVLNYYTNQN